MGCPSYDAENGLLRLQVVQHDLFAIQASLEDLQRFLALQPGPLATLAVAHYLRTCQTQRTLLPHPQYSPSVEFCSGATSTQACAIVCDVVARRHCECTRYGMDGNCAGMGLRWLRETLPQRAGDQLQITLRLWHLGPPEPLGGWRTRDVMSTVSSPHLQQPGCLWRPHGMAACPCNCPPRTHRLSALKDEFVHLTVRRFLGKASS
jgi:hypothetical protein